MSRGKYSAIVLRYVHDQVGGEFVNVGLMLICKLSGYAEFSVIPRTKRVVQFFPGARARSIRAALRQSKIKSAHVLRELKNSNLGGPDIASRIVDAACKIVPADDSGLQWSSASVGITSNPKETFDRLWERLILRYEDGASHAKRTDEQVWKTFSKVLEKRSVFARIEEHEVKARLETVTFKRALKNGKWHLLEPVSFDLASPESVTDKAKRILGEMTLLRESDNNFKLYLLVGGPASDDVRDSYGRALDILGEIPCEKEIYLELEAERLARDLSQAVVGVSQ